MKIEGIILNAFNEEREMLNKQTGRAERASISHLVMQTAEGEIINARSFRPMKYTEKDRGKTGVIENVRKYENYSGAVADVTF